MSGSGRLPFSLEKTRAGSSFQPFRSFWASLRTNHARKVFVSCCERSTRRPLPLFGVVRLPSFQGGSDRSIDVKQHLAAPLDVGDGFAEGGERIGRCDRCSNRA